MEYQELERQWPVFSAAINALADQLGLAEPGLECDHVSLRFNEFSDAQAQLAYWQGKGTVISDNIINGRPIYIIKLDEHIQLLDWHIRCVELPFPAKPYPQSGWEHIELVLPGHAKTMEELQAALDNINPHLESVLAADPSIKVKMSSPKGDKERLANPTIAFKQGNVCIKVHSETIEAVIASESLE